MGLTERFRKGVFLMEGALGERLKREYGLPPDELLAMGAHVYDDAARKALAQLWRGYLDVAKAHGFPFLATTPTRRLNRERIGLSCFDGGIIPDNVRFLKEIQREAAHEMYAGALLGCRGDAYSGAWALGEGEAERYHAWSIERFAAAGVDFFFAGIMPALTEAAGMAKALSAAGIPYIISFMIRENGRLMDGTAIHDAIGYIDACTVNPPQCYMVNCVHPDVLYRALRQPFNRTDRVRRRFRGIQANTSPLPPEELDQAKEGLIFDCDNPEALARFYAKLLGGTMCADPYGGFGVESPALKCGLGFQLDEDYQRPVWPGAKGDQLQMLHIDIRVEDRQKAMDFALSIGASMPEEQFCEPEWDVQWVTLLDPAGHPFCLFEGE